MSHFTNSNIFHFQDNSLNQSVKELAQALKQDDDRLERKFKLGTFFSINGGETINCCIEVTKMMVDITAEHPVHEILAIRHTHDTVHPSVENK